MFCPKCGASLEDGAKFCGSCGAVIGEVPAQDPVQAPAQIPVQAQAEKPAKKSRAPYEKASGGKKFLCVLLSLLGGLFLLLFLVDSSVRFSLNKQSLTKAVSTLVENEDDDETISDMANDLFGNSFWKHMYTKKIMEVDQFPELFAGIMHSTFRFLLFDEGDPINVDEVVDWFDDNKDAIKKATGSGIDKAALKSLEKDLSSYNKTVKKDIPDDLEDIDLLHFVFGKPLYFGLLGAVILFFGLVFIVFRKRTDKAWIYFGTTAVCNAIVFALLSAFPVFLKDTFMELLDEEIGALIIRYIAFHVLILSAVLLVVGIISIIIGKSLRRRHKVAVA